MLRKKGQVTLFVIITILIVAAVMTYFFIYKNYQTRQEKLSQEIAPFKVYVEDCIRKITIEALELIGLQGGYYEISDPYLPYFNKYLAYYYYDGRNTMPSKAKIEESISNYVSKELGYCIDSSNFPAGVEILFENFSINTSIEKNIIIKTSSLAIKKNDEKIIFKEIKVSIPFRLKEVYEKLSQFIKKEVEDPGYFHISYLTEILGDNFHVNSIPFGENNIIFIIEDKSPTTISIFKKPYILRFANKY
ncbi:MAG: hypothetical protein QXP53_02635 [Candidatus Pacearchaeota archaeon]